MFQVLGRVHVLRAMDVFMGRYLASDALHTYVSVSRFSDFSIP